MDPGLRPWKNDWKQRLRKATFLIYRQDPGIIQMKPMTKMEPRLRTLLLYFKITAVAITVKNLNQIQMFSVEKMNSQSFRSNQLMNQGDVNYREEGESETIEFKINK